MCIGNIRCCNVPQLRVGGEGGGGGVAQYVQLYIEKCISLGERIGCVTFDFCLLTLPHG